MCIRDRVKYDMSTRNKIWKNTGSGSNGHDYRSVPGFVSSAYFGSATGDTADIIRVTEANDETTVRALGTATAATNKIYTRKEPTAKIYFGPNDTRVYKMDASTLNIEWTSTGFGLRNYWAPHRQQPRRRQRFCIPGRR